MPSEKELREQLNLARRRKHESQHLIKKLTDQSAPKGAKKSYRNLKAALRRVLEAMQKRIPALRKRIKAKQAGGAERAVAAARHAIGITESPPYSNLGPGFITDCQRYTGYNVPPGVFWCGCAVCWWVVKEGGANIPNRIRLGFDGYINADANAGANGLKRVSIAEAQPGDIVTFDFHHIALVVKPYDGSSYLDTIDGNTSPNDSGSQNNGGGVFPKRRFVGDVVVVARPAY